MLDTNEEITKFLPHREPFLFIDKIIEIELGKSIHCIKIINQVKIFLGDIFLIILLCLVLLY